MLELIKLDNDEMLPIYVVALINPECGVMVINQCSEYYIFIPTSDRQTLM